MQRDLAHVTGWGLDRRALFRVGVVFEPCDREAGRDLSRPLEHQRVLDDPGARRLEIERHVPRVEDSLARARVDVLERVVPQPEPVKQEGAGAAPGDQAHVIGAELDHRFGGGCRT
jgi:hypothetical protein